MATTAQQYLELLQLVREVDGIERQYGLPGQEVVKYAMEQGISPSQAAQRMRQEQVRQRGDHRNFHVQGRANAQHAGNQRHRELVKQHFSHLE